MAEDVRCDIIAFVSYANVSRGVEPPSNLLPMQERQAECEAHLADLPGIDVLSSVGGPIDTWPQGGLYVTSWMRPGFNGNVTVSPYRTIEYQEGLVTMRGCGLFAMVYENPAYQSDVDPVHRMPPDYVPLSLAKNASVVVRLRNGGRLLVQKRVASAQPGVTTTAQLDTRAVRSGLRRVERLIGPAELEPLLGHLALGMGLAGRDVRTFSAQAVRKVRPFA